MTMQLVDRVKHIAKLDAEIADLKAKWKDARRMLAKSVMMTLIKMLSKEERAVYRHRNNVSRVITDQYQKLWRRRDYLDAFICPYLLFVPFERFYLELPETLTKHIAEWCDQHKIKMVTHSYDETDIDDSHLACSVWCSPSEVVYMKLALDTIEGEIS